LLPPYHRLFEDGAVAALGNGRPMAQGTKWRRRISGTDDPARAPAVFGLGVDSDFGGGIAPARCAATGRLRSGLQPAAVRFPTAGAEAPVGGI
jgi:hypothetical protein